MPNARFMLRPVGRSADILREEQIVTAARRRRTKRKFSSEKVSGKAERPSEKFDGEKGMEGVGENLRLVT